MNSSSSFTSYSKNLFNFFPAFVSGIPSVSPLEVSSEIIPSIMLVIAAGFFSGMITKVYSRATSAIRSSYFRNSSNNYFKNSCTNCSKASYKDLSKSCFIVKKILELILAIPQAFNAYICSRVPANMPPGVSSTISPSVLARIAPKLPTEIASRDFLKFLKNKLSNSFSN